MGNDRDGLIVSPARDVAAIEDGEDAPLELDGGVGSLIEDAPHGAVALGGAATVVHSRGLFLAGASTHPGGKVPRGRKRRRRRAHFGDDLLRRIHSQTGHFCRPLDLLLVGTEQGGHLLLELADLRVEALPVLDGHLHQPTVDGRDILAGAERVAQLLLRGTQAMIGEGGQRCRVGFPLGRAPSTCGGR